MFFFAAELSLYHVHLFRGSRSRFQQLRRLIPPAVVRSTSFTQPGLVGNSAIKKTPTEVSPWAHVVDAESNAMPVPAILSGDQFAGRLLGAMVIVPN